MNVRAQRLFFGSRRDIAAAAVLGALLLVVFGPTLGELFHEWTTVPEYGHGLLMPPLAAWMVWTRRRELRRLRRGRDSSAFALLAAAALVPVGVALLLGEMRLSWFLKPMAFVAALTACVGILYGWRGLRALLAPLVVLALMCPVPWRLVVDVTLPLKRHASVLATGLMDATGLDASLDGNLIHVPGITSLWVADACSGVRSLISLVSVAIVGCLFWKRHWLMKAALILACPPIAVLVNGARIWLTAVLAVHVSPEAAEGFFHVCEGFALFGVAVLLLLAFGWTMHRLVPRRPRPPDRRPVPRYAYLPPRRPLGVRLAFAGAVLALLAMTPYVYRVRARLADDAVDRALLASMEEGFSTLPLSVGKTYAGEPVTWRKEIIDYSGADAYRAVQYVDPDGRSFNVYLAGAVRNADNFHAPNVCMPSANWETIAAGRVPFTAYPTAEPSPRMQRLLLQKGEDRMLTYFWFQTGEHLAGEEWSVRFRRLLELVRDEPLSPTMIVSIYVPVREGVEETEAAARDFLSTIGPYLRRATASGGHHG